MARVYGSKYDNTLSRKEIAVRIREDIKAAVKAGQLPAGDYSVRIGKGGSRSIDVDVKGFKVEVQVLKDFQVFKRDFSGGTVRYAAPMQHVLVALKRLADAYNHDGSDISSDYFDVNFYLSVNVAWTVEQQAKARMSGVPGCAKCSGWDHHAYECEDKKPRDISPVSEAVAAFIAEQNRESGWLVPEAYGWQPPAPEVKAEVVELAREEEAKDVSTAEKRERLVAIEQRCVEGSRRPILRLVRGGSAAVAMTEEATAHSSDEVDLWTAYLQRNGETI